MVWRVFKRTGEWGEAAALAEEKSQQFGHGCIFNPFMDQISQYQGEDKLCNFSVQCVCLIVRMLMYECEVLLQIGSQAFFFMTLQTMTNCQIMDTDGLFITHTVNIFFIFFTDETSQANTPFHSKKKGDDLDPRQSRGLFIRKMCEKSKSPSFIYYKM